METITLAAGHLPEVLVLNNGATPNVNEIDASELADLVDQAELPLVVLGDDGTVLGFALALRPGGSYRSLNYHWFSEKYDDFLYVDRIVVAEAGRNTGVGAELYRVVTEHAVAKGVPRLVCDVNVDPPNPGSMRFHQRLGFTEVGQHRTNNDTYQVALLAKEL